MNKWKRLILEILGIAIVSFVFSIVYNFFSPKPLPLIKQETKVAVVADSLLDKLLTQKDTLQTNQFKSSDLKNQIIETETKNELKVPDEKKAEIAKADPVKPEKDSKQDFKTLSYNQLLKYLNNPNVLIIDARNSDEFEKGHIGNAINIYAYESDQSKYFASITALPMEKIIIIYCDGGNCDASHKLSADISSFGFKKVFLYSGGWDEWTKNQSKPN